MSVIILDKPVKKVFVGLQQKATNDQEIREYLEEIGVTYLIFLKVQSPLST